MTGLEQALSDYVNTVLQAVAGLSIVVGAAIASILVVRAR